jgi:hypothetical protein
MDKDSCDYLGLRLIIFSNPKTRISCVPQSSTSTNIQVVAIL